MVKDADHMTKDMAYIVAIDSFKGCMDTREANEAARRGLLDAGVKPERIHCFPVSDGGEGFESVVPSEEGTAFIESARHCGYNQLSKGVRDPHLYSSYALGQRIAEEAKHAKKIVIGLGGTCTVDGGIGMLQALGAKFTVNENGRERLLEPGEPALEKPIVSIDTSNFTITTTANTSTKTVKLTAINDATSVKAGCIPRLNDGTTAVVHIEAWSDTRSPLCGPDGAVMMYGPQKGLAKDDLEGAEKWMNNIAELYTKTASALRQSSLKQTNPVSAIQQPNTSRLTATASAIQTPSSQTKPETAILLQDKSGLLPSDPGCGAAGGIGAALHCILGAEIKSGAEQIIKHSGMLEAIKQELEEGSEVTVITGEGRLDRQTATGKLPACIAIAAKEAGATKTICVCGNDASHGSSTAFDAVIQITPAGMSLEEAMKTETAQANLRKSLAA